VKRVTPLHELDQPQDVVLADVGAELALIDSGGISPTLADTFFMHVAHVIAGRDLGGPLRLRHDNCAA
jgi:hypothetical protein